MKKMICLLVVILLVFSLVLAAQRGNKITEDDPRWDCHTMGNKICGEAINNPNKVIEHNGHFDLSCDGKTLVEFESKQKAETYAANNCRQSEVKKQIHTCGVMTKKGIPCKRKVKNAGVHCWQHNGSKK